ncbi:hypothetical protein AB5I41_27790 [Sphingomonas sp. MMS24-JH45]
MTVRGDRPAPSSTSASSASSPSISAPASTRVSGSGRAAAFPTCAVTGATCSTR